MHPSAQAEYLCKRPRLGGRADFLLMTDFLSSFPTPQAALPRRTFLRVAGASAATVGLVLAGCTKPDPVPVSASILSFGSETTPDKQILNYLFFIKQLEFAFYDKVVKAFPADMSPAEQASFLDLRDHELVHRQVMGDLLGTDGLSALPLDFTSVSLTTRAGVLAAAKKIEDTASGAFLGILLRVKNTTLFMLLAKMSSVEARHAALISDLLLPGSFAAPDVVVAKPAALAGQAVALSPVQVATVLGPFVPALTINTTSLPAA